MKVTYGSKLGSVDAVLGRVERDARVLRALDHLEDLACALIDVGHEELLSDKSTTNGLSAHNAGSGHLGGGEEGRAGQRAG